MSPRDAIVILTRPSLLKSLYHGLRSRAGRTWRALRHTVERLLHPMRRSRARSRLSEAPRPRRILVICLGNICRSPYLEAILRKQLPDIAVESGGFLGPGRQVPNFSSIVSTRRGYDLSAHRSRVLTPQITGTADLLVVMDSRQARRLRRELHVPAARILVAGDIDPWAIETRTIKDPFRQPIDAFESCFDRLDRIGRAIADALNHASTNA
jgi:protein-tyrosine phosphatase